VFDGTIIPPSCSLARWCCVGGKSNSKPMTTQNSTQVPRQFRYQFLPIVRRYDRLPAIFFATRIPCFCFGAIPYLSAQIGAIANRHIHSSLIFAFCFLLSSTMSADADRTAVTDYPSHNHKRCTVRQRC
jgi:hypothetical protein